MGPEDKRRPPARKLMKLRSGSSSNRQRPAGSPVSSQRNPVGSMPLPPVRDPRPWRPCLHVFGAHRWLLPRHPSSGRHRDSRREQTPGFGGNKNFGSFGKSFKNKSSCGIRNPSKLPEVGHIRSQVNPDQGSINGVPLAIRNDPGNSPEILSGTPGRKDDPLRPCCFSRVYRH